MGYDPYREEARTFTALLLVGAAFLAGFVVHALISPYLDSVLALVIAVAAGLAFEVVLAMVLRRRRHQPRP